MYAARRERFLEAIGPGVAVLSAAPVFIRNNDVEHAYRQDSDFYYLSGFDEPEAVLVLTNQHPEHRMVLFVRPLNPEREIWDGPRAGVEGAVADFGADAAFPMSELQERLPAYLGDVKRLHYRVGRDGAMDARVFAAIDKVRGKGRTGVRAPSELVDPTVVLHEHRLCKAPDEVACMRSAAEVTREAHARAMQVALPGHYEYEVEAEMQRVFRAGGSERAAYESIVGSGPNATILHYRKNGRKMEEGDLLLIDAGCEHSYYASDVTRTFPISGEFTAAQRKVYDAVLESQRVAIEATRPGATLEAIHGVVVESLTRSMLSLGLLEGDLEELIEEEGYKPYYMHRTSHWLGMDVHDVGAYFVGGEARPLEAGFVLTIEPGLYIPASDEGVPPEYRGLGIRIEDDILVTADGHEDLTASIPKDPDELERILAKR